MSLGGSLAENILCLLSYNEQYAPIIRNSIPLNLWGGPQRIIASKIYDYIDRFKVPPRDHLADILSDKIESDNAESALYTNYVLSIRNAQEGINTDYIVHQLETFIKRQSLRTIAVDLTKALQRDTEESLEEAEKLISQSRQASLQLFDPGTRLSDKSKALNFLDFSNECFPTGIKELDKYNFGPTRKELWLLIANTKGGKSFALIHLGKMAIANRLRVVHITLEMSEGRVAQRYFQSLYSIAKRKETPPPVIRFELDDLGRITGSTEVKIDPKYTLDEVNIREKLEKIIDKWGIRQLGNIFIKEFPTGSLTVNQLEAYLDNLEATQRFTPDLLIIDYPDLMKLDADNFRLSLDKIYKDLRGIAVQRNLALAVVSQSHRSSSDLRLKEKENSQGEKRVVGAGQVRASNVAESYSKIAHADCIITLSATDAEKRLGLARLYVAAGRNDADNISIVISQHYRTGSFAVYSARLTEGYWANLGEDESS